MNREPITAAEMRRILSGVDDDIIIMVGEEPVTDWRGTWHGQRRALRLYVEKEETK